MKTDNLAEIRRSRTWLREDDCRIEEFAALQSRATDPDDYPFAAEIAYNVPVYDGETIRAAAADPAGREALLAEWAEALMTGPGIVALPRRRLRTTP